MPHSLILKNKSELQKELKNLTALLTKASKNTFTKTHFKNRKFKFRKNEFNLENWHDVPIIEKGDFSNIGPKKRLGDALKLIKKKPRRFVLQSSSGTSQITRPVLFIKNVDWMVEGQSHGSGERMLILYQPRAISLRDTIALINQSTKSKTIKSLVVNPFRFDDRMIEAVTEFHADSTVTFPACISYILSSHKKALPMLSKIKNIWLSGDFFSGKQKKFILENLPQAIPDLDYISSEVDTIGMCCKYLIKKYGDNVYHPFKERLIELINIDENGIGEVVVTKPFPIELSIIRYRIGDVGRAVNEKCKCGDEWSFFLEGRKNMDYIKQLGVLITRAEIERVLRKFEKEVEDWRGEVKEQQSKGMLLGELTLFLKFRNLKVSKNKLEEIKKVLSQEIRLTPTKTLHTLSKEYKFMPLQIKAVEELVFASKKVPLRKVLN